MTESSSLFFNHCSSSLDSLSAGGGWMFTATLEYYKAVKLAVQTRTTLHSDIVSVSEAHAVISFQFASMQMPIPPVLSPFSLPPSHYSSSHSDHRSVDNNSIYYNNKPHSCQGHPLASDRQRGCAGSRNPDKLS